MSRVAIIVADDFEDTEFSHPQTALRTAGHEVTVLGLEAGAVVTGKNGVADAKVELPAGQARIEDYDALVIPGGYSPDRLRLDEGAVGFTRSMVQSGKPVAAICHAGQLLVEAGVVDGRTVTSWPSVRTELRLAGAEWVDREVVVDDNLITSRKPADLDAFSDTLLQHLPD